MLGELLTPEAIGSIGIALAAVGGWILSARRLRGTALTLALIALLAVPAEAQQVRILEAAKKLAAETTLAVPQTDDTCAPGACVDTERRRWKLARDEMWFVLAVSAAVVVLVVMSDGVRRPEPVRSAAPPPLIPPDARFVYSPLPYRQTCRGRSTAGRPCTSHPHPPGPLRRSCARSFWTGSSICRSQRPNRI